MAALDLWTGSLAALLWVPASPGPCTLTGSALVLLGLLLFCAGCCAGCGLGTLIGCSATRFGLSRPSEVVGVLAAPGSSAANGGQLARLSGYKLA